MSRCELRRAVFTADVDEAREGPAGDGVSESGADGMAMATYWESLLGPKWEELKKKELDEVETQHRRVLKRT